MGIDGLYRPPSHISKVVPPNMPACPSNWTKSGTAMLRFALGL